VDIPDLLQAGDRQTTIRIGGNDLRAVGRIREFKNQRFRHYFW